MRKQALTKIKHFKNWLTATHLPMGSNLNLKRFDQMICKKYFQNGQTLQPFNELSLTLDLFKEVPSIITSNEKSVDLNPENLVSRVSIEQEQLSTQII